MQSPSIRTFNDFGHSICQLNWTMILEITIDS
uniref:Uncharacterized protein n=1 Tax=Anguilla anguilla TaxID=7936 RepID=A0A0E9RAS1_ANGAN